MTDEVDGKKKRQLRTLKGLDASSSAIRPTRRPPTR